MLHHNRVLAMRGRTLGALYNSGGGGHPELALNMFGVAVTQMNSNHGRPSVALSRCLAVSADY